MARAPISPELALIDPTLALSDTKEAWPMMNSLDPTNTSPPPGNESAAVTSAETRPLPSVEALLFNAGAISADQLGELVRDAVLTQRPVTAIALERGLATPEMLAALQTSVGIDFSLPGTSGDAIASSRVEVSEEVAVSSPMPAPPVEPEPVELVVSQLATTALTAVSDAPVTTLPQPEPLPSFDERVQAAVARAVQAPQRAPAPGAATPEAQTGGSPEGQYATTTATFTILVRLRTGERLTADTAATYENATEVARSLAGQLARAGEWPLIAGRCIRPDAIVSVDIERALER